MWNVERPGWLFTPSTIGNQVWDRTDDELIVDGSVLYPVAYTGTDTMVIVGHTGCGAVTAALEYVQDDAVQDDAIRDDAIDAPPGVAKWVELLVPVVEDGLADDRVDPQREPSLVDQLVEYNVDRQVTFLRESDDVPDETSVYGFMYDFQGVYGDVPGRLYLVTADGQTDTGTLQELVPDQYTDHVQRLL
jgi:carbonic anhydrase